MGKREGTIDTFRALGLAPQSSLPHQALLLGLRAGSGSMEPKQVLSYPELSHQDPGLPGKKTAAGERKAAPRIPNPLGANLCDVLSHQKAMKGAVEGPNLPWPNQGLER